MCMQEKQCIKQINSIWVVWVYLFFNVTQFVDLKNLSVLDFARPKVKQSLLRSIQPQMKYALIPQSLMIC